MPNFNLRKLSLKDFPETLYIIDKNRSRKQSPKYILNIYAFNSCKRETFTSIAATVINLEPKLFRET